MPRLCGGLGGVAWASLPLPLLDFTLAWQHGVERWAKALPNPNVAACTAP